MSFWAIALLPKLKISGSRQYFSHAGGDTPSLLPQNIAKSMRIKKAAQARAVRRPQLQIIERSLERQVADDAGQSPRQIRRLLVRKEPSGHGRGAPQLHQGDT